MPAMISVVMCSRDDNRFAAVSAQYAKALAGVEYEIVRIPDATGICEGYNRGITQARGEWLLLSHDDVVILARDFAANVTAHFQRFDLFGIAGTTKLVGPAWHMAGIPWVFGQVAYQQPSHAGVLVYGVPAATVPGARAVDGVLIGARRELCHALRFDEAIPGWHMYDLDFSYRAHLAGFECGIACDLGILHLSQVGEDVYRSPPFRQAANVFYDKHKSTLPPIPPAWPQWTPGWVKNSPEEAGEVMRSVVATATALPTRLSATNRPSTAVNLSVPDAVPPPLTAR